MLRQQGAKSNTPYPKTPALKKKRSPESSEKGLL